MKSRTVAKPASTRITLTLPDDLLAVLDAAAAADNRTRSNLIAYSLRRLKEANPCLAEPRSQPTDPRTNDCTNAPHRPCPRGHIRPWERPAVGAASERTASHGK